MSETNLTPEDYRRRYFELKAKAQEADAHRSSAIQAASQKILTADRIDREETIPAGWYWTSHMKPGQSLRIVNIRATHGVSALFWNARDTSERFNPADSVKVQWSARLARGKLLLSDMGRVLASITDDTCGHHDCVAGASTRSGDARKYGANPTRRNSHENFVLAAAKHGLSARDVGPCITFFAPVVTDQVGRFEWREDAVRRGDYVDLRAEMDVIVALSNCPHPLSPRGDWRAEPVHVCLWRSPNVADDDLCRTATQEAVRAFENTVAMS
jgi:urea carboxylase-associated protein 2